MKEDQVLSILTDVVGAVSDVENTLHNSPSHEKKAAAMTVLGDAVKIASKNAPADSQTEIADTVGKTVDIVVQLKNLLGQFKHSKHRAATAGAKKTA